MNTNLVIRDFEGHAIRQRAEDRYFDATGMCKASGKQWSGYYRNERTNRFLDELSSALRICRADLVQVQEGVPSGGSPSDQGTWVHPRVAMHLAQWCSTKLEVAVSGWVFDLLETGHASTHQGMNSIRELTEEFRCLVRQEIALALTVNQQPITSLVVHEQVVNVADRIHLRCPGHNQRDYSRIMRRLESFANDYGLPLEQDAKGKPFGIRLSRLWMLDKAIDSVWNDYGIENRPMFRKNWGKKNGGQK